MLERPFGRDSVRRFRRPANGRAARRRVVVLGLAAALLAPSARSGGTDSPEGRWQTFDDRTHAPRGIVRLFEKDGRLFGRIEHAGDRTLCRKCPDERKDQPLDGLVIIRDLRRAPGDPRFWEGGDVVDPETGRIYRLTMRLGEQGSTLVVHGYLGVPLVGRSQTWTRAPD